ncbi:MAG: glycosyltransferase family 2 protein [bacterium]|nr:glycosyltransferase family 2 protein [bacterium]
MNEKKPLISVIIPCYNQGHFLNTAIKSILDQDYSNFEIIIINDGSTDLNTVDIISQLKKQNLPYIRIYSIKNRGLAGARNYGLDKAAGDFIQFLDADDQLLPGKWKKQLAQFFNDPNLDVSYTKFYFQLNQKKIYPPSQSMMTENFFNSILFDWDIKFMLPPHAFLFKKHCFISHRFVGKFTIQEDLIMWTELALNGFKFAHLDYFGALYFRHENNLSGNRNLAYYSNALAIGYIRDQLINNKKYKSLLSKYDKASIERLKYIFYEYFQNDFLKNNPDKQELEKIKSSKFFKLWQSYNAFLRKIGIKNNAFD